MRLIDADKFEVYSYTLISPDFEAGVWSVLEKLDAAPTIDAVPIRHGQWETNSDKPDTLICSVCKCGFDMWKHDPHNFCPNCGAKMDKEKNE